MLSCITSPFTAITLTETWTNEQNLDLCFIENYQSFHTFRPQGHIYSISGGVSVFCLETCKGEKLENYSICNSFIETCVVKISYNNDYVFLVGVYRPPQGNKHDFVVGLNEILGELAGKPGVVAVTGDFNLNLQSVADVHITELTSTMYARGLFPCITKPTRFPNNNSNSLPTTLDHIWTDILKIKSSGIIDFDQTDHLPCFAIYEFPNTSNDLEKIKIESRPYSEANLQKLTNKLQDTNWDSLLDYNDIDSCTNIFLDKINSLYIECFPLKIKFISRKRIKNKWITHDVKRIINEKSEIFKQFRRGVITRAENNRRKNALNKKINKAKNEFYFNAFERFKNDAKQKWKLLNGLLGTDKNKKDIIGILDGNDLLTETVDIVNKFADFFSTIGQNLDSQLPTTDYSPLSHINRNPNSFYICPATIAETSKIISNLKAVKTDKNHMPTTIFKSLNEILCLPLTKIINASFSIGLFPKSLKLARLTPVFKKNDKNVCSNYRQISSLPYLSKIFERLMTNRIINFFNKFKLFSLQQFGFLRKKSTQDAVLDFTEKIYDALNSKQHALSILIDLKSAFDTVNHDILLAKLELYGLRGPGLDWIRSYLTDRETFVALRQTSSNRHPLTVGIPQGSIIGPILFIIYINDLPSVSDILSCTLFADDTNFTLTNTNYNDMTTTLNSELVRINDWTTANRLTINVSKTELLLFTNRDVDPHVDQVSLNGDRVGFVGQARFLGVIIDNSLNFKEHLRIVAQKVSKHSGILYKLGKQLPISARISYYNSFCLPYLSYNIVHWGGTNACHLNHLVMVQKRLVRTIAGKEFLDHTTPLFYNLKILKLADLYKLYTVVDTHKKILNGQYQSLHNRDTRCNGLAVPKFQRLSRTQQSLTFRGPTHWNELPVNLQNIESVNSFKKSVKNYYISLYDSNLPV